MNRAACTISSRNYLPFARTLCESFLKFHPNYKFYVLLVDRLQEAPVENQPFELVLVEDLNIPEFHSVAFRYDILELNTNVKPTFMKALLNQGIEQLLYFDPDIFIYSSLDNLYEELDSVSIALTPHAFSPNDESPASEVDLLRTGVFNLGFLALSATPETFRFLDWWEQRCLSFGYDDRQKGLFVDQKWTNLVPCFFDSYKVLKDPGYNVAYWNLHERHIQKQGAMWTVNDVARLIFYHFSGIIPQEGTKISKHSDQFDLTSRPDIKELLTEYRKQLLDNGLLRSNSEPYAFGRFSDGTLVNRIQRAAFLANIDQFRATDPFDAKGPFYAWAKRNHLQSNQESAANYNKKTYRKTDIRVKFVNSMLRLSLRMLGADKYSVLMKYLAYISQLRNQKDIFEATVQIKTD